MKNNVNIYISIKANLTWLGDYWGCVSNKEIARKIGLSPGMVDKIMRFDGVNDNMNLKTLDTLGRGAGCHPADFLFKDGVKYAKKGGALAAIIQHAINTDDEGRAYISTSAKLTADLRKSSD